MVRVCSYPGCWNQEKSANRRAVSFHRVPVHDIDRLQLWMIALRRDLNCSVDEVRSLRVCDEHFSPEDFLIGRTGKPYLKNTAVPIVSRFKTEDTYLHPAASDTMTGDSEALLAGVPHFTPVSYQPVEPHATVQLVLKSPEAQGERTHPSTSGIYLARPPVFSSQRDIQTQTGQQSLVHSFDISVETPDSKDTSFVLPSSASTSTPVSEDNFGSWHEKKWVVNNSKLMQLFKTCHQCGAGILEPGVVTNGSLIKISWECTNGHSGQWSSCPEVNGMPENNLLMAASILFTGATYTSICDWACLLNLQVPQKSTYCSIQSSDLITVIDIVYQEQHQGIMERLLQTQYVLEKAVHVSGDGRLDRPGFSGKYNTNSFLEDTTKEIILFELVQMTEASSSAAMEPVGFRRGLNDLLEQGAEVEVVATDQSPSIRKVMRENYPEIHHEFQIWHVVKGLMKELVAASSKMDNRDLQPWIKSICNHLWYACATCEGDPDDLEQKWKALLHHICGVHRWEEDGQERKCVHGDLSAEQQRRKRWIQKDSSAFKTLTSIALDKGLMMDLRHMALFKHTGKLEVFRSAMLKYSAKRLHFFYSSINARTQFAVMDHSLNVQREQATTTTSGNPRSGVVHPKQTKEWVAKKIYVPTTQTFRQNLVVQVQRRRQDTNVRLNDPQSRVSVPRLPANMAH